MSELGRIESWKRNVRGGKLPTYGYGVEFSFSKVRSTGDLGPSRIARARNPPAKREGPKDIRAKCSTSRSDGGNAHSEEL